MSTYTDPSLYVVPQAVEDGDECAELVEGEWIPVKRCTRSILERGDGGVGGVNLLGVTPVRSGVSNGVPWSPLPVVGEEVEIKGVEGWTGTGVRLETREFPL